MHELKQMVDAFKVNTPFDIRFRVVAMHAQDGLGGPRYTIQLEEDVGATPRTSDAPPPLNRELKVSSDEFAGLRIGFLFALTNAGLRESGPLNAGIAQGPLGVVNRRNG